MPHLDYVERLMLPLLAEGLANKEIAARMHISDDTVTRRIRALCRKLQARVRTPGPHFYPAALAAFPLVVFFLAAVAVVSLT